jgi:hypothetical protein
MADDVTIMGSGDAFEETIAYSPEEHQPQLRRLFSWASELEGDGLAHLVSVIGRQPQLRICSPGDDRALVTLVNVPTTGARLRVVRSVFERTAPDALERLQAVSGREQEAWYHVPIDNATLSLLRDAYRTAADSPP